MGHNRKLDKRRLSKEKAELVYFVRSIFAALDYGLVQWPKHINGFTGVIRRAYAGDLEDLRILVDKISRRGENVKFNAKDSEMVRKWKIGINGKYIAEFETMNRFYGLLREYWSVKNAMADSLSKITFGKDCEQLNTRLCEFWETQFNNRGVAQRENI